MTCSLAANIFQMNATQFIGGAACLTGGGLFAVSCISWYATAALIGKDGDLMANGLQSAPIWQTGIVYVVPFVTTMVFAYMASIPIITAVGFFIISRLAINVNDGIENKKLSQFGWAASYGVTGALLYEACMESFAGLKHLSVGYRAAAHAGAKGGMIALAAGISAYALLRFATFGKISEHTLSYIATAAAVVASSYFSPTSLLMNFFTVLAPVVFLYRKLHRHAAAVNLSKRFIQNQNLIEQKNGDLFWQDKNSSTGMKKADLIRGMDEALETGNRDIEIVVKLKEGNGRKRAGISHLVMMKPNGEIQKSFQKVKDIGKGTCGKIQSVQSNGEILAAKFADRVGVTVPVKIAEWMVNNEGEKLIFINPKGHIRGLQQGAKHRVIVIDGKGKRPTKIGFLGTLYDGDIEVLEFQSRFEKSVSGMSIKVDFYPKGCEWKTKENWTTKDLIQGCDDLIFGLEHCHANNLVLGDIKPANIFRKNKKLFLADLGGACGDKELEIQPAPLMTALYATVQEMRDLVLAKKLPVEKYKQMKSQMDVFALGLSLFEILTEKPIFTKTDSFQLGFNHHCCVFEVLTVDKITKKIKNKLKIENDHGLGQLIYDMVCVNPERRVTSKIAKQRMTKIVEKFQAPEILIY